MSRSVWLGRAGMAVAVTAVAGIAAAPAQAASTGQAFVRGEGEVRFVAASDTTNKLVVSLSGRTVTFDDRVRIKAGAGCKAVTGDRTKVRCTLKDPGKVHVTLGARNDSVVNKTGLWMVAYGGSGNDSLTGSGGEDQLYGDSGTDQLAGLGGNDTLTGGSGGDTLRGGAGRDDLYGKTGDDKLYGDTGDDVFHEGATVSGTDLMVGGSGRDTATYHARDTAVVADADGVKGDDGAKGEHDTISADVENLYGGSGNDLLIGTAGANTLSGNFGVDRIIGGAGDDILWGLWGADVISGGLGNDVLLGGPDRDTLYGQAGDDDVSGEDGIGGPPGDPSTVQAADKLDGGADGTAAGDLCRVFAGDTAVACER